MHDSCQEAVFARSDGSLLRMEQLIIGEQMKSKLRWMVALTMLSGTCLNTTTALSDDDAPEVVGDYVAEQRAAAAAREKDPAWKPTYNEVSLIRVGDGKEPGALKNFCLNGEGNILACYGPTDASKSSKSKNPPGVRVYSPTGDLLATYPLEIKPGAICVAKDGSIYVAGDGKLLKLNATGKVIASAVSPVANDSVVIGEELKAMIKEMAEQSRQPYQGEFDRMQERLERRRADVTGLAVTEQDVYMAVGAPSDFSYRVYRFDSKLKNPKLVVEKLRGCCGQMDLQAHEGKLWIPHNARHCVESRDRDGKELAKFGKAGKVKPSDFGGCCEPKSLRILPNGDILAAESGPPTCIKRFSPSGKFIEVIAALSADTKGDCVRVTVEASADGKRYYMLDTTRDAIRVFAPKS